MDGVVPPVPPSFLKQLEKRGGDRGKSSSKRPGHPVRPQEPNVGFFGRCWCCPIGEERVNPRVTDPPARLHPADFFSQLGDPFGVVAGLPLSSAKKRMLASPTIERIVPPSFDFQTREGAREILTFNSFEREGMRMTGKGQACCV